MSEINIPDSRIINYILHRKNEINQWYTTYISKLDKYNFNIPTKNNNTIRLNHIVMDQIHPFNHLTVDDFIKYSDNSYNTNNQFYDKKFLFSKWGDCRLSNFYIEIWWSKSTNNLYTILKYNKEDCCCTIL